MFKPITKKFNLQIFISYFGILPIFIINLDIHIFNIFSLNLFKNFLIFYTLLIFSFIGAMRWNFDKNSNSLNILYGFIPSLISTILIFLNILNYNKDLILIVILFFLFTQVVCDYLLTNNNFSIFYFYYVRLPITIIVLLNIIYFIVV
tara:strand:+ start:914 stop:1357 length:444 start_codon:yes stop_codon:yes gene_type:complete